LELADESQARESMRNGCIVKRRKYNLKRSSGDRAQKVAGFCESSAVMRAEIASRQQNALF